MLELTKRLSEQEAAEIDSSEILDNLILPYELRIRGRLRATTQTRVDVGLCMLQSTTDRHRRRPQL